MDPNLSTVQLHVLMDRFQKGDQQALEDLLRRATGRLESLARAMLRRFPIVRQHEQTGDIVQEASLSLIGALRHLSFASTREFYGLATEHMRRRLLDLARRYKNPIRSPGVLPVEPDQAPLSGAQEQDLDRWQTFHEAVETLPVDCREVFSLRFYHNWGVDQVAELLQMSPRTVARVWSRAILAITAHVGEKGLPDPVSDRPQ